MVSARDYRGAWVGVMITASHNQVHDNGLKLINAQGHVLSESLEVQVEDYVNNVQEQDKSSHLGHSEWTGRVLIGWDTRPSSVPLASLVTEGIKAAKGQYFEGGLMTTPQCHFTIWHLNEGKKSIPKPIGSLYTDWLTCSFKTLQIDNERLDFQIVVDMANGVGAATGREMLAALLPSVQFVNDNVTNYAGLNDRCGADYVKQTLHPPVVNITTSNASNSSLYFSLDGDADRLVAFRFDQGGSFRILDGDKIVLLMALYVKKHLANGSSARVALVHTAYANGAAIRYAREHLSSLAAIIQTPTGVKHLHRAAANASLCDIGIYWEPNGHGTVLFNTPQGREACGRLASITNEFVGDGLSNLLMILLALHDTGMSVEGWDGMYEALPCSQRKVTGVDRKKFIVDAKDETLLLEPQTVRLSIESFVIRHGAGARAFIRPSGTEDAVRVYAEASTQVLADSLASAIEETIKNYT